MILIGFVAYTRMKKRSADLIIKMSKKKVKWFEIWTVKWPIKKNFLLGMQFIPPNRSILLIFEKNTTKDGQGEL